MSATNFHFPGVSLLITHYNRSSSLERLLKSFDHLNCTFDDIIVSDDGSEQKHLDFIEQLKNTYSFTLVTTPTNKGLGNNINKGQDAVKSPLTLYIQEDFVLQDNFPVSLQHAVELMDEDPSWDLISFYAYLSYPYKKPFKYGFSERIYKSPLNYSNTTKYYLYSDHPHLRRTSFLNKFGRYKEGINGDETEIQMSLSFIKNKGRSLVYDDHYGLLTQLNSNDEPSTATFRKKISWKDRENVAVKLLKKLYATFKLFKMEYKLRTFKA